MVGIGAGRVVPWWRCSTRISRRSEGGELRSECLPGGVRRDARASRPASARLLFDEMRSRLRAMGRPQGSDGVPVLLAQPSFHADMLG
jgi:hypothetical protein